MNLARGSRVILDPKGIPLKLMPKAAGLENLSSQWIPATNWDWHWCCFEGI